MTKASICKCGHTKTDHKPLKRHEHLGACLWDPCGCKKFRFTVKKYTNSGGIEVDYSKMPTLIDCNYSIKALKGEGQKRNPQKYLLEEADKKGHAQNLNGYHPKIYNNGEYL